jgi:hypothetical protein
MKGPEGFRNAFRFIHNDSPDGLDPGTLFVHRSAYDAPPLVRSVVRPDSFALPEEMDVVVDNNICHDCGQVRAMVKLFIEEGYWTVDQFRKALGAPGASVSSAQLLSFLRQEGPHGGWRSKVFVLAWEFFHRRGKLRLPLIGSTPQDELLLGHGEEPRLDEEVRSRVSEQVQVPRRQIQTGPPSRGVKRTAGDDDVVFLGERKRVKKRETDDDEVVILLERKCN